jgi:cytochrome c-type biogenesis protein CcmI
MTLLVLSVLLAVGAAGWVIAPLVRHRTALVGDVVPGRIQDAEAHKHVTLTSLQEVEYDYLAGKLDEADYQALRVKLSREALGAMKAAEDARLGDDTAHSAEKSHACGFMNPPGSRFCAGCGARLS